MDVRPINCRYLLFRVSDNEDKTLTVMPYTSCIRLDDKYLIHGDKKISLRNGMKSLKSKLELLKTPIRIHGLKLPDDFYDMIDERLLDSQNVEVWGTITKEILRHKIKERLEKNKNANRTKAVLEKGAVNAVKEGHFSIEKLPLIQNGEDILKEAQINEEKMKLDLPYGKNITFNIFKTKKQIKIQSFKDLDTHRQRPFEVIEGDYNLNDTIKKRCSVKRKHYFFYSTNSGYGKSTVLGAINDDLNCSFIQDFNNFAGVRENSQFLLNDEFGHTSKITVEQLKALTGGQADSFVGNKKSFGKAFKPRRDVQLILASNRHLFECVGSKFDQSTKRRTMNYQTAKQLFDRFHIHKFDDELIGEVEYGASCLATDNCTYEPFTEDIDIVNDFIYENRVLVRRYGRIIGKYLKQDSKKRSWLSMMDDGIDTSCVNIFGFINTELYVRFINNLMRYKSWHSE